jgi:hypothetical protein
MSSWKKSQMVSAATYRTTLIWSRFGITYEVSASIAGKEKETGRTQRPVSFFITTLEEKL